MKILLDECIDRRLAREFSEQNITTVSQMGWSGTKNGKLLALAEQKFDVFITVDRSRSFEQNLKRTRWQCHQFGREFDLKVRTSPSVTSYPKGYRFA